MDPISMLRDGGPFMYLLILVGMALPVAVFVPAALGFARLRAPAALWAALGLFPLAIGAFGTWIGHGQALSAIGFASEEMVPRLASMGLAVGLYTLDAGALLAGLALAGFAASVAVGAAGGIDGQRSLSPLTLVPGVLVGLLAVGCALVGSFPGLLAGGLVAVALLLAGLQNSDDEGDRTRLAAARSAVAGLGALALLTLVVQTGTHAILQAMMAEASASIELRQMLVNMAWEGLELRAGLLTLTATATLIGGLATAVPVGDGLADVRSAVHAGAMAFVVLAVGVLLGLTGQRAWETYGFTIDPSIAIQEELVADGVTPPKLDNALRLPVYGGPALRFGPSDVRYDGRVVTPSTLALPEQQASDPPLWLQASGHTRLSEIAAFAPALEGRQVWWVGQNDAGLRAFEIPIVRRPAPDEVPVALQNNGRWTLGSQRGADSYLLVEHIETPALLPHPEVRNRDLHVWWDGGATVQDLVDLVNTTERSLERRERAPSSLTWRVDSRPTLDGAKPSAPAGAGKSTVEDPIILGALDRSLIDAVIKRNMNQIRYCYQRELTKQPSLQGKIVVKFVIAKDGSVSSATKKASTMGSAPVEQCLIGRFMRMKFPEPKGGGIVIVSYPFVFAPQ